MEARFRKNVKLVVLTGLVITFFALFAISCRKETDVDVDEEVILQKYLDIPSVPFNYSQPPLPAFFDDQFVRIQDNTPSDNRISDWGATLGRVLFYDTRLSLNNSISCASCHKQEFGFTDTARFSKGFNGGVTGRHSMALANAAFYINGRFFWDERAATLEEQVLVPLQDPVEMGMRLDTLMERLRSTEFYPVLFTYAFGKPDISPESISNALAQFIRSMVSYRSKYDEGRSMVGDREKDFPNFTAKENLGKRIFMTNKNVNCFGCHNTDVFITDNPRNNGTSIGNLDQGVMVHTRDPADIGKFKAPSLKNVALRGTYMHDGKLVGLASVLQHYNSTIQANANLDPHLKDINGNPLKMNLSADELVALQKFLETLTDEPMLTDEKFSSPFK